MMTAYVYAARHGHANPGNHVSGHPARLAPQQVGTLAGRGGRGPARPRRYNIRAGAASPCVTA